MLQNLKQRINQTIPIKYTLTIYLGAFLIYSSWALGDLTRLWKGLFMVIAYAAFDLLWTYFRDHSWYLPVSSLISGLILSLVALPNPPLWLALLLPLLAVASKQAIHLGKLRHVFNPASFALGATALLIPSVSWWGVAWGATPFIIASLAGIIILWRQERWHIALPFFASYALFLALLFFWNGIPASKIAAFLKPQLLDGTAIFFATVMLIEPLTSQFPTKRNRVVYGLLVGFFAVVVTFLAGIWNLERQDPLIYGLLIGNLTASVFFLSSRRSSATTIEAKPL